MRKKKGQDVREPAPGLFDRALRLIALAGIYGALLAVVVVADATAYPFVFLKSLLLQATVALTVPSFLVLAWRQPAVRPRRAWISLALGVYFFALVFACVFAFHRYRAFWGSQDRMGGLFSLTHFFVWYVMATSLLRTWGDWRRLLHWQAILGFVVAWSALVELGDPRIDRISGVLGNPIYTATYQLFSIGILALLWGRTRSVAPRVLYAIAAVVSLITLLYTGSRGGLLGLVAGLMAMALAWAIAGRRWRYLLGALGTLAVAGAGYGLVVRLGASWLRHPGVQHLFTKTTYELRPMIWSSAWAGFRARPLLGWGPDNFEAVWDAHFVPRSICAGGADSWTDTAHSIFFEHLSTTGIVGTLAFAAIWVAFALSLRRASREAWIEAWAAHVLLALSVAYLVQAQFITDSPSSHLLRFLLLAVGCAAGAADFGVKGRPAVPPLAARTNGLGPWVMVALQAGGFLFVWHVAILPALASHQSLQSKVAFGHGGCGAMLESARRAAAVPTPWSQDHLTVLSQTLRDLVKADRLESCPQWRDLYDLTRQKAGMIYAGQPEHFRFRGIMAALTAMLGLKVRDKVLLDEAKRLYEALIEGSPRQQFFRSQLARLLVDRGQIGAGGEQLAAAVAADPEMGESIWWLGFHRWYYENQPRLGSQLIVQSMVGLCRHNLDNAEEAKLLAQAFLFQGDLTGLRSMEGRMQEWSPADPRTASVYLDIARFQEQAGLLVERDRMLRIAVVRDGGVGARLAPVFDGSN